MSVMANKREASGPLMAVNPKRARNDQLVFADNQSVFINIIFTIYLIYLFITSEHSADFGSVSAYYALNWTQVRSQLRQVSPERKYFVFGRLW